MMIDGDDDDDNDDNDHNDVSVEWKISSDVRTYL